MRITIYCHPNSKKPRIETDLLGALHVFVNEPPLEGKANRAIRDALALHYGISKSRIELVSGEKSKIKIFDIQK